MVVEAGKQAQIYPHVGQGNNVIFFLEQKCSWNSRAATPVEQASGEGELGLSNADAGPWQ